MSGDELVPKDNDVLASLDFDTPLMLSTHDAIHWHFAVSHALFQLNITPADIGLATHRYAKPEWIADALKNVDGDDEKIAAIVDELGEFAIECSDALANFLLARGIGGAHFFVFLPCHGGVAQYWPRNSKGKPELAPWS